MFREFFSFELRYQLRSPLVWVLGFAFALFAFMATTTDVITIGEGIGNVNRNAPYVILTFLGVFSTLGMLLALVFSAQPLLRDFELGTEELFFSTPMRKSSYLWGRFSAGIVIGLLVFVITAGGMILGSFMPWLDPQRLGPFSWGPYLWGFGIIVIPNLVFIGALLSLLAVTTRRLLMVFLGVIGFFVLYAVAQSLMVDIKYDTIASLIDPFGGEAATRVMRYWSVTERNTRLPEISGLVLTNRAIWLGLAAVMFAAAQLLFQPQRQRTKKRWWHRKAAASSASDSLPHVSVATLRPLISGTRSFDASAALRQFRHLLWFDTKYVLKSLPFLVLLAFGLLNFIVGSRTIDTSSFGTPIYPVTALMMQAMQGSYQFLLVFVIGFYAGDLLWRERDAKLAEVTDASPVPSWVPMLAKVGTITAVVLVYMAAGVLAGMVNQLTQGYTNLEPGLYLRLALADSVFYILMGVLAVFLQVISNQKFVGYLLLIVGMLAQITHAALGYEHNLYIFGGSPELRYSDMDGLGPRLEPWAWFNLYWSLFSVMLIVLASAFWVRGTSSTWKQRWRHAIRSLRGPQAALLGTLTIAFVAVGAWIFYNTNVINEYLPKDVLFDRQARLEKEYRKFMDLPQPRIRDVRTDVDLFPEQRRAVIRGHYRIENAHAEPIPELHVYTHVGAKLDVIAPAGMELRLEDAQAGLHIYKLREPLAPGASMDFDFTWERHERGFTNTGMPPSTGAGADMRSTLNYNGTFFNSGQLPHFGYDQGRQIIDRNERRKRGLGPVPRMPKLEDEKARQDMGFIDSDWINFEATVSTSSDQIALAPGYLQREWTEHGRHYFHYKMDRPMLPYYCFLSARWQVKRGEWQGVPIEIYYDAKHAYNVDGMIDATRKSLDYYTANFSPYQSHQVRILEFPRYARFAQSFANTIPYSESIGFIADVRDPHKDVDYVFYVTAHEMAHQWWGHQVVGGGVQGQTLIMESLSQYSALMVMEKQYGREHMRRFLRYELDRYLKGRGGELVEELPLMRVEDQGYIHYSKGSLVLYRLRDEIGEANMNRALANYIRDKAYQKPPYTTTLDLLDYIRAQAPADKHQLIEELFAKITFYDNRVVATTVTAHDGKYDVTIEYQAAKSESDGLGHETAMPLDDWIEVGVFARGPDEEERNEKPLYLERQHITQGHGTIRVTVDELPYDVGFDPYNKLIDRMPDDNRKTVDEEEGAASTAKT